MFIRALIVVAIFTAWAWFAACELVPAPRASRADAGWPDSPQEPDAGRGGYFGRPDADVSP